MAPGSDVSMYALLSEVALRSGLIVTEASIEAERDHLLEELNRFKMKYEQLKKLILEMDFAMKAIPHVL